MSEQQTAPINQYLQPLLDHKKLLLVVWAAVIALGVAAGFAAPVSYSSTAAILVYPSSGDPTKALETDDADIDMPTELRIATSQAVINLVVEQLAQEGIGSDPQILSDNITASSTKESTVLDLTFVAATPQLAASGANAFAQSYLDFRAELASSNKLSAESAINARIVLLQERLSAVQTQLNLAAGGNRVVLESEKATIEADLAAQQIALGALSTPTIDATVIIDEAEAPSAPEGLGFIQIIVGAIAGGLVTGVVVAYVVSAYVSGKPAQANRAVSGIEPDATGQRATNTADHTLAATTQQPATDAATASGTGTGSGTNHPETTAVETSSGDAGSDTDQSASPAASTADGSAAEASATETADLEAAAEAELPRPEPLQDRRTPTGVEDGEQDETSDAARAMIVSGDMEPVIRYLQGIGTNGSVATMVVGEREPDSAATITIGLAEALQTLGARVLMIDAGVDSPTLDSLLRFDIRPGLVEVTNGTETLSRAVRRVGLSEGLDVLTVGSVDPSAGGPKIRAASFERLLNEARLQYHTILVAGGSLDTSPVVSELAPLTDGLIVGTDRRAGELADPVLHDLLAELPTPTLELLSGPSIGGMVAKLSGSTAPGM